MDQDPETNAHDGGTEGCGSRKDNVMPKIRTPDDHARQLLFNHTDKAVAKIVGIRDPKTVSRRRAHPGTLRLDELAAIVKEDGITAEEVYGLLMERGKLMI